jgi:hypothetical protein
LSRGSSPFCSCYLRDRFPFLPRPASTTYFMPAVIAGMSSFHNHTQVFSIEIGLTKFFSLAGLEPTPPISVSRTVWGDGHTPLHPAVGWDGVSQTVFWEGRRACAGLELWSSQSQPPKLQVWASGTRLCLWF